MPGEKDNPLISCIVPTYKRNDSLLRAIKSVLNQSYSKLELIVVDDNEPDDEYSRKVQDILLEISDKRVKYVQQDEHKNGAAARNFGVVKAKGEFIAFLDDDDEWELNKIEEQLKLFKTLPSDYGAVSCLSYICKENNIIGTTHSFSEESLQLNILQRLVEFNTSTVLFDKSKFIKMGGFNESLRRHQDLQLFVDFLNISKIALVEAPLIRYNVDDANNRLDVENLIKVKVDFFEEIKSILSRYNKKVQKDIFAAHYFEIIYVAIKERKFDVAIKYLHKVGFNYRAYNKLLQRGTTRIKKN